MQICCPLCGTEYTDNNKVCRNCGNSLTGDQPGITGRLSAETVLDDRYVVVRTIGQGGMGAVYLALDKRLENRAVAVKEMSTNAVGRGNLQAAVAAFKQEASILISLKHQALPTIYDFFSRSEERWYLVMDYIVGKTLKEVARERGKITEEEVLDWARQLCNILGYLHSRQPPVIFRDLKPANIMISPDGTIKLIDFGIARHFHPGATADTAAYGSIGFAPPEQYGQEQTNVKSDIYALGATLHFLLTGLDPDSNPFTFEPPGKLAKVSTQLEKAIMRAVEFKPENRPRSAAEMLALLPVSPRVSASTSGTLPVNQGHGLETLDTTKKWFKSVTMAAAGILILSVIWLGFTKSGMDWQGNGKTESQASIGQSKQSKTVRAPLNETDRKLAEAVNGDDLAGVQQALDDGANSNTISPFATEERTVLAEAARSGNGDIVEVLLARGAGVDFTDVNGSTPLIYASDNGQLETVKKLLAAGAKVNATNIKGWTPLIGASFRGHAETVRVLLEAGADVNNANNDGQTAIIMAPYNRHTEVIQLLLKDGANINMQDSDGDTALYHAALMGNYSAARELVESGAALELKNRQGKTPLMIAEKLSQENIVDLLIKAGAKQ